MPILGFCCPAPDPASLSMLLGAIGFALFAIYRSRPAQG